MLKTVLMWYILLCISNVPIGLLTKSILTRKKMRDMSLEDFGVRDEKDVVAGFFVLLSGPVLIASSMYKIIRYWVRYRKDATVKEILTSLKSVFSRKLSRKKQHTDPSQIFRRPFN